MNLTKKESNKIQEKARFFARLYKTDVEALESHLLFYAFKYPKKNLDFNLLALKFLEQNKRQDKIRVIKKNQWPEDDELENATTDDNYSAQEMEDLRFYYLAKEARDAEYREAEYYKALLGEKIDKAEKVLSDNDYERLKKVIDLRQEDCDFKQIANRLNVSYATVKRLLKKTHKI